MKNESEIKALIEEALSESQKALTAGDVRLAIHYANEASDLIVALTGVHPVETLKERVLH